ncbi:hypothetical protein L7F22_038370 [Adiantum nelumboides]|nr:hypothetical protein [Adiantum nelumboides]
MSSSAFECSICLRDSPNEPVLTCCGHVFCWPCIFRWLTTKRVCPLCNGCLSSTADFTPIYSSSKDHKCDVDMKDAVDDALRPSVDGSNIPPRPPAHRRHTYGHGRPHLRRSTAAQHDAAERPSQAASWAPGTYHLQQQVDDVVTMRAYVNYEMRGSYLHAALPVALPSGYRAPPPSPARSEDDIDWNPSDPSLIDQMMQRPAMSAESAGS